MILRNKRQPSLIEIISEPTSPYHISDEDERRIRTEAKKLRRRIMSKSLTDDELFRIAMFDNTELADFFARCYVPLYEPGSIESVKVDYEIPTAVTKSSRLDAYAEAGCTVIDFEMESARRGSIWNRSRQYVANLTNSFIIKGDGYRNLPRIVVVFFIPYDILGKGKPFYVVMPKDEDGDIADPGDVRIYVNWNYEGDDEYGRIAHDIRCVRPEEMYHEEMRARVLSLKAEIGGEKMAEDYYSRLKREWNAKALEIGSQHLRNTGSRRGAGKESRQGDGHLNSGKKACGLLKQLLHRLGFFAALIGQNTDFGFVH